MFKIESMPAKVCLGLSAFLLLLYSISFMFFSIEYVTGGDTGFALIDNGLGGMTDDVAYGWAVLKLDLMACYSSVFSFQLC